MPSKRPLKERVFQIKRKTEKKGGITIITTEYHVGRFAAILIGIAFIICAVLYCIMRDEVTGKAFTASLGAFLGSLPGVFNKSVTKEQEPDSET